MSKMHRSLLVLFLVLSLLLLLISAAPSPSSASSSRTESEYQAEFHRFLKKYGKNYFDQEFADRYRIFKENLNLIESHNSGSSTSQLIINQFADQTAEEIRSNRKHQQSLQINRPTTTTTTTAQQEPLLSRRSADPPPKSVDWRKTGAVPPVQDQGQCGVVWSVAAAEVIESAVFISKGGPLLSLSDQQLLDCSEGQVGSVDGGFQFVIDNKGICSSTVYPSVCRQQQCRTNCSKVASITSYTDVPPMDEEALMAAVAQQPVAAYIEADQPAFQFYSGGIIEEGCGTNVDHVVIIVGYDTDNKTNTDYWIIKNSWGSKWGMAGYAQIIRNKNECGIATLASYPVV